MTTLQFTAKVTKNGSLTLPKEARERLGLHPGDEVEISVQTPKPAEEDALRNPLYDLIGIAKGGKIDGAENHDAYLYGKKPS